MMKSKKSLLSILVASLFVIGCMEESPPRPPFVPEEVASAFLKKLEINYTGVVCTKMNEVWGTCTVNIDNKMQKLECYSSARCELINK